MACTLLSVALSGASCAEMCCRFSSRARRVDMTCGICSLASPRSTVRVGAVGQRRVAEVGREGTDLGAAPTRLRSIVNTLEVQPVRCLCNVDGDVHVAVRGQLMLRTRPMGSGEGDVHAGPPLRIVGDQHQAPRFLEDAAGAAMKAPISTTVSNNQRSRHFRVAQDGESLSGIGSGSKKGGQVAGRSVELAVSARIRWRSTR